MNKNDLLNILSDKKVLYAEDEEGIRKKVVDVLELFFEEVVSVNDGQEAIEEMVLGSYDVLIVDICMPNIDGLEAIKKIRTSNKNIPIIILSAHTEQNYLWRAVELKITKFLTKPYDKETLLKAFEEVALELVNHNLEIKLKSGYIYNPCEKAVYFDTTKVYLSKKESRLLEYFINRANQTVLYECIFDYLWEFEIPTKEAIKSIVKELRKKVGTKTISNIYGIGYMLEL